MTGSTSVIKQIPRLLGPGLNKKSDASANYLPVLIMAAIGNGIITLMIRRKNFEEIQENFDISNIKSMDDLFQKLGSLVFIDNPVNVTAIWSSDTDNTSFIKGKNEDGWVDFSSTQYMMHRLHVENWNWGPGANPSIVQPPLVEQDEYEEHIIDMEIDHDHVGQIEEVHEEEIDDDDAEARSEVSQPAIQEESLVLHYSGLDDDGQRFFSSWPSNFDELVTAFSKADRVMATFL